MTPHFMMLLITLVLGLAVAPLAAEAPPTGKVYRIGCLAERRALPESSWREGLRGLGYVEGHNLLFECRRAETREQLPALAAEVVMRQLRPAGREPHGGGQEPL